MLNLYLNYICNNEYIYQQLPWRLIYAQNNNTHQTMFDTHISRTVYTDGQSFDFLRTHASGD